MKGEARTSARRQRAPGERGQVVALFGLLLPMMLAMGAIVIGIGNWFVHAKNLQTKVDAAALAGGAVWGFPCGADVDAEIEAQARMYVGSHTAADLTTPTSPYNPQVGHVGGDRIHVSLNQAQWWSGGFAASDFSDPSGPVCQAKILDVKATEQDVSPIWKLIPLFPDVKRKARVQIEDVAGLTGLLPIAVRLPQPLSAAAVFFDESSPTKAILDVKPFRQMCTDFQPTCIIGAPPSLGQWTTEPDPADPGGTFANFPVAAQTGVVVATSVRPLCGAGTPPATQPCMDMNPTPAWTGRPIDDFCRHATRCVATTPTARARGRRSRKESTSCSATRPAAFPPARSGPSSVAPGSDRRRAPRTDTSLDPRLVRGRAQYRARRRLVHAWTRCVFRRSRNDAADRDTDHDLADQHPVDVLPGPDGADGGCVRVAVQRRRADELQWLRG